MLKLVVEHIIFILGVLCIFSGCAKQGDILVLRGDYLRQEPPGDTPKVFAPDIISHGYHEHCLTISPDGNEMSWSTSSSDHNHYAVIYMKREHDIWQNPVIANFTLTPDDMAPRFSPDGKRLFFCSRHAVPNMADEKENFDIYYVEKSGDSWSDPVNLGGPVNTGNNEFAPSFSANGNVYFQYWGDSGEKSDIYFSRFESGQYQEPQRLEYGISAADYDGGPFISPDEDYLLFQSVRPENIGNHNTNLYLSFRDENDGWSRPINLGESINASGNPIHPMISPDGRYLFFATNSKRAHFELSGRTYTDLVREYQSVRNGYGTHYWVDAKIIEALKPDELK